MSFDPVQYKTTTRQQWEDAAEAWHRWGPTIEDWLGEATGTMLRAAGIGKDDRVLDVAAGSGLDHQTGHEVPRVGVRPTLPRREGGGLTGGSLDGA